MAVLRLVFISVLLALSARAVEIRFVPAASEGTVSLGIFDASGQLVRLLCDEWPMANFSVGLNGLSTEWDGKDDSGKPVAPGTYRARGFVVGPIDVQGEAIHFNGWIDSEDAPPIVSVAATCLLPGGDMLIAARLVGNKGALFRYSPQGTKLWQTLATEALAAPVENVRLAAAEGRGFVLLDKKIRALDLASGKEIPVSLIAGDTLDIAARDGRLAVLRAEGIEVFSAADSAKLPGLDAPPVRPVSFALLDGDSAVVAGEDGSLWLHAGEWKRLDVPERNKVRILTAGRGKTFWSIELNDAGSPVVAQYSPEEGRLAEWISPEAGAPEDLSASTETDYFSAVFAGPESERTVAIRRKEGGGWELVTDKTITSSDSFGWAGGKLSAVSGDLPSGINVDLRDNPLDPAAPRALVLNAAADGNGTGLSTPDGLPLVRVSDEPSFVRVMVVPGAVAGTAHFYQGDGASVQQYRLGNLADITAFDAGTIEMEGGAEKPPPPEQEVAEPTP